MVGSVLLLFEEYTNMEAALALAHSIDGLTDRLKDLFLFMKIRQQNQTSLRLEAISQIFSDLATALWPIAMALTFVIGMSNLRTSLFIRTMVQSLWILDVLAHGLICRNSVLVPCLSLLQNACSALHRMEPPRTCGHLALC